MGVFIALEADGFWHNQHGGCMCPPSSLLDDLDTSFPSWVLSGPLAGRSQACVPSKPPVGPQSLAAQEVSSTPFTGGDSRLAPPGPQAAGARCKWRG